MNRYFVASIVLLATFACGVCTASPMHHEENILQPQEQAVSARRVHPSLLHVHSSAVAQVEQETQHESHAAVQAEARVPAWTGWVKMMCRRPNGNGVCAQDNSVTQVTNCDAVSNNYGLYEWGTADAAQLAGNDPADPGAIRYVGRARGVTIRARCNGYNTGAWGTIGSHKTLKFQEALNQCKCIYYRHIEYSNADIPTHQETRNKGSRREFTVDVPNYANLGDYIDALEVARAGQCNGCDWNVNLV